jgi:hypothetical protein
MGLMPSLRTYPPDCPNCRSSEYDLYSGCAVCGYHPEERPHPEDEPVEAEA